MKAIEFQRLMSDYSRLRASFGITRMKFIVEQLVAKHCCLDAEQEGKGDEEEEEEGKEWKLSPVSMYSMIAFDYQQEMRSNSYRINANLIDWESKGKRDKDYIFRLSDHFNVSPAITSQRVVSKVTGNNKIIARRWFTDTTEIPDGKLAFQVMVSQFNDLVFGPHANHVSRNVGHVFEQLTAQRLKSMDIEYVAESDLRSKDYDVTPDFKLNLPLLVKRVGRGKASVLTSMPQRSCVCRTRLTDRTGPGLEGGAAPKPAMEHWYQDTEVVNWIECKSLFASWPCHLEYQKNQYTSYFNRFGKGVVIYRYGFVENVDDSNRIIVLDMLPFAAHPHPHPLPTAHLTS